MATNKVVYGDRTLIDLTNDSVSSSSLLEGETAHDRSGTQITGSLVVTEAEEIEYEDYDELTEEEKNDGSIRFIPNYPGGGGIDFSTIINAIYPVGSILMSADSANPSTRFPNTTWIAWGSGQVPVGVNTSDTDFNTVEKTGGSKTKSFTPAGSVSQPTFTGTASDFTPSGTVSQPTFTGTASDFTPSGTVSQPTFTGTAASLTHSGGSVGGHTLTTNEIPAHNHPYISDSNGVGILYSSSGVNGIANTAFYLGSTNLNQKIVTVTNTYANISKEYGTKNRGGGGSHSHGFTQPSAHSYTPAGSVSQPTFTGTKGSITPSGTVSTPTFTGTKGSITPSGTVSTPTFTGTESDIETLQPYITCYMWKRTA